MPRTPHNTPAADDETISPSQRPEKDRKAAGLVNRLWSDGSSGLELIIADDTLWELRERSARRYLGDHWDTEPPENFEQAELNWTLHAIQTSAAVQIERPWTLDVTPVESDEPGTWWVTQKGIDKLMMVARDLTDLRTGEVVKPALINLEHLNFSIEELSPSIPLDENDAQELVLLTEPQLDQATGQAMPPILEVDIHLVHLTDAKCAEEMQRLMSRYLNKANITLLTHYAQTLCDVHGDQAFIYEWDTVRHCMKLKCPNWTNVRFDPRSFWISDASYCLMQESMTLDQALDEFPDARGGIKKSIQEGTLQSYGDSRQFDESARTSRIHGTGSEPAQQPRQTVRIRTLWKKTVFDEKLVQAGKDPELQEADEGLELLSEGRAGQRTEALRDGRLTDEPRASFRERYGIRQIKILVETDQVLEDVRCPYPDFPLPYLKNTIIPYSPYGLGDPVRLEDTQNMINRVASYILNTMKMGMFSEQMLPGTVYDFLDERDNLHRSPGRVIRMDDDLWIEYFSRGGSGSFIVDPPAIDSSWVNLLFGLINQFKELAGDTDALSGQPASSDASGKLQENLEGAASRTMAYKAATLEHTFEWICRLLLDSIVEWLPDEEWDRILSKYAGAIRESMRSRMKRGFYDLKVKSAQGRGAHDRIRAQKADAMFARGAITRETYLEMMEHPDPHGESMKVEEELRRAATGEVGGSSKPGTAGTGPMEPPKPNESTRGFGMSQTESPVPGNGHGRL